MYGNKNQECCISGERREEFEERCSYVYMRRVTAQYVSRAG